jgi:hypothetical protein
MRLDRPAAKRMAATLLKRSFQFLVFSFKQSVLNGDLLVASPSLLKTKN